LIHSITGKIFLIGNLGKELKRASDKVKPLSRTATILYYKKASWILLYCLIRRFLPFNSLMAKNEINPFFF
jgi:hypothetical protein